MKYFRSSFRIGVFCLFVLYRGLGSYLFAGEISQNFSNENDLSGHFILIGVARINSQDYVTLLHKESQMHFVVSAQPDKQGIRLIALEINKDLSKTKATVGRGEEVEIVRFDTSLFRGRSFATQTSSLPTRNLEMPIDDSTPESLAEPTTIPHQSMISDLSE